MPLIDVQSTVDLERAVDVMVLTGASKSKITAGGVPEWSSVALESTSLPGTNFKDFSRLVKWMSSGDYASFLDRTIAPTPVTAAATNDMRAIQSEISKVRVEQAQVLALVQQLSRTVSELQTVAPPYDGVPDPRPLLLSPDPDFSEEDLSDGLNACADEAAIWSEQWRDIALRHLTSGSPALRAASARALAFREGASANDVLQAALNNERNRFVRSIMQASLSAASV